MPLLLRARLLDLPYENTSLYQTSESFQPFSLPPTGLATNLLRPILVQTAYNSLPFRESAILQNQMISTRIKVAALL